MRFWIPGLLLLPLTCAAAEDGKRCQVSFDAATLDVCTGELKLAHEALRPLGRAEQDSTFRIVKFDAPIRAEQRRALEAQGVQILGYAPHYAYLVRMDAATEGRVKGQPGVLWTGPYLPVWKVDVNLANDLALALHGGKGVSISGEAGIEQLSVALQPGVDASRSRGALRAAPGLEYQRTEKAFDHERVVFSFERSSLAEAVTQLAQNPDVATISLRWPMRLSNSQAGWLHQSGRQTPLAGSMPAFENGLFGCGQIIGAADTGLHASHCSFADTNFGQPVISVCATGTNCSPVAANFAHRKIGAHYKWGGSTSGGPADGDGHGTHVFASIAGNNPATGAVDCSARSSPGGLTDLDGTAPGAKLVSQELGPSLEYLNDLGGTIFHAAQVAYQNGARTHSNSWGGGCRNANNQCIANCLVQYDSFTRDADAVVWQHPQLALLVAAGNSGGLGGSTGCGPGADVGSPGNAKNVFSIGSNSRGASGNSMSNFSSRGPTVDRRVKPDMTAQGGSIVSASVTACGTTTMSGTSMATPTAAGLSALVREYLQRGFYPTGVENPDHALPTPSAALIKAIMINGAQEITGTGTTGGAPSQSQGWGRVNLGNSLYFDADTRQLWLEDNTAGLETNAVFSETLSVEAGAPLIVTLAWHDAPALVNANPHGVNQLRLEVQAPDGQVWTQKLPADGGLTNPNPVVDTTTVNYDDRNNVHSIELPTPVTGSYIVRVRGIQVAQGPQPFALTATGKLTGVFEPDFVLQANAQAAGICAGDPLSVSIGARAFVGFNDPVTLSHSGLPAGLSGSFSVNPVVPTNPAAASVLSITNTGTLPAGSLSFDITASTSGPGFPAASKSRTISVAVDAEPPVAVGLASPADAAVNLTLRPNLSWDAIPGATGYRVQIANNPQFTSPLVDVTQAGTSYRPTTALASSTQFYWRVAASNRCGAGDASAVRSFTTSNMICSEPALSIPDSNTTGATSLLNVTNTGALGALRLGLKIDHSYIGDLRVWLSKGTTTVELMNRPGASRCSGDNMDVILADGAPLSVQTNCTASTPAYTAGAEYTPATPLAAFAGTELSGQWSLRVSDNAGEDTGQLVSWCLLPAAPAVAPDVFKNGFEATPQR
ncbi:MAG: S8 family serine peptidase [Xanthomonadales bacterium]|nr:S8 family serine peptidase [Xanthomonadales bacterium]